MRQWFKGCSHPSYCVDFQTVTSLYEVKSCELICSCANGNYKRPFRAKPHKKCHTSRFGRFFIKNHNHYALKAVADREHKLPKYVFVALMQNQKIWKVLPWETVDKWIHTTKKETPIPVKNVFQEEI
jgi:hypothetical protein